jgi:acyl-CoA synthetase (AMP-forming)/AMP-acid ligase II
MVHGLAWLWLGTWGNGVNLNRWLDRHARFWPTACALVADRRRVTWSELRREVGGWCVGLRDDGVAPGQRVVVCLPSGVELVAAIVACARIGVVPVIADAETSCEAMASLVDRTRAVRVIVPDGFVIDDVESEALRGRLRQPTRLCRATNQAPPRIAPTRGASPFVLLATSGSTGAPKLCPVSHGKAVLSGHGFGKVVLGLRSSDTLYCPLPLSHATGLLVGWASCLVSGATLVLPRRFSASRFWDDLTRHGATHVLYVGELWRYAMLRAPPPLRIPATLRVAMGSGLDERSWDALTKQSGSPRVVEFYGASELPGVMFNLAGKKGAMGHVSARRLSRWAVVSRDPDTGEFRRDARGRPVRCGPGEVGELLLRVPTQPRMWLGAFEGYQGTPVEPQVLERGLFEPGDCYYRTSDLVRFDSNDYFYFVERCGDVVRQNAENVSSRHLEGIISSLRGIIDVAVVDVRLGERGPWCIVAAIVCDSEPPLTQLSDTLLTIPRAIRPRFVRVLSDMPRTRTFKIRRDVLRAQSVEPDDVHSGIYAWHEERLVRLDQATYRRLCDVP